MTAAGFVSARPTVIPGAKIAGSRETVGVGS
jgi:hypothetical protein